MKLFYFLALLCLALLVSQCKKEDTAPDVLPPITQEGKNTAGFLLDGEVWVPFAKCGFFQNPCEEAAVSYGPPSAYDNYFSFQISRENNGVSSTITINGQVPIFEPGDYTNEVNVSFRSEEWSGSAGHYSYNGGMPGYNGSFILTRLDTINEIMSGIFTFTLKESNGSGNTIKITDGRFDYELNACICRN